MQLSEHFGLSELTHTDIPGMQEFNLSQAMPHVAILKRVAEDLLEPIRYMFGSPVVVNSGFRCLQVNTAVGGSPNSQHMEGEAADFNIEGWEDRHREAQGKILASGLYFHQLLIERGCLHISLPKEHGPNGEVAYWDAGEKVVIVEGKA